MNDWIKVFVQYRWGERVSSGSLHRLPGYPHIFTAEADECALVVKKLLPNEYLSPDEIFRGLFHSQYILFPLLTEDGHYFAEADGARYLVYPKIGCVEEYPSPEWWGSCLRSFHAAEIDPRVRSHPRIDDEDRVESLFGSAEPRMDREIAEKLRRLLRLAPDFPMKEDCDRVLCHGDPSLWNVLQNSHGYKLIDAENCFPSPREYDIQHLLWNQGGICDDFHQWDEFWRRFRTAYESESQTKIDSDLLIRLFCLDFVKTMSWLYLVSRDNTREDQSRQLAELTLYEKMIRRDFPEKMIAAFGSPT